MVSASQALGSTVLLGRFDHYPIVDTILYTPTSAERSARAVTYQPQADGYLRIRKPAPKTAAMAARSIARLWSFPPRDWPGTMNSPASRLSGGSRPAANSTERQVRKPGISHCPGHPHQRCCWPRCARIGPSRMPCTGSSTYRSEKTPHATARTMPPAISPSCDGAPSMSFGKTLPRDRSP